DGQFQGAAGHLVAGLLDGRDQFLQGDTIAFHAGVFAGQVDLGMTHTAELVQRAIESAGATGAGHAADGNIEGGGHGAPPSEVTLWSTLTLWHGQARSRISPRNRASKIAAPSVCGSRHCGSRSRSLISPSSRAWTARAAWRAEMPGCSWPWRSASASRRSNTSTTCWMNWLWRSMAGRSSSVTSQRCMRMVR